MLQLLQPGNKHFSLIALSLAVLVNITLAGLIYGLTIGSSKLPVKDPITIDFRKFTDSSVEEEQLSAELNVTPELQKEAVTLPPPVPVSFDVQNINLNSSIKLSAVSVPTFDIAPLLMDVTSNIQPEVKVEPIAEVQQVSIAEPKIEAVITKPTTDITVSKATIGEAKVLRQTKPQYPYKAQRRHIEGYAILHILIDDTGKVQEVKVIEENPRGYT